MLTSEYPEPSTVLPTNASTTPSVFVDQSLSLFDVKRISRILVRIAQRIQEKEDHAKVQETTTEGETDPQYLGSTSVTVDSKSRRIRQTIHY